MALALASYSVTTFTAAIAATSTETSPSFSPAAGDVIYCVGFIDNGSTQTSAITENAPTNTGTALTWNFLVRENSVSASNIEGSLFCWWAYNANAQASITVTVNSPSSASLLKCVAIIGFTGASSTQSGVAHASTEYTAANTTPTLANMTTTQAGSWCWMAGLNWTNFRSGLTAHSGQAFQVSPQNPASAGDTIFLQKENPQPSSSRPSGTVVTMADTGGTASDFYHLIGWEVIPQAAAAVPQGLGFPVKAKIPGQQGEQLSRPGLIYVG